MLLQACKVLKLPHAFCIRFFENHMVWPWGEFAGRVHFCEDYQLPLMLATGE